jgi:5S rRNA maturation endonuclease (ribonuclease M5)
LVSLNNNFYFDGNSNARNGSTDFMRKFLKERKQDIDQNPDLKTIKALTRNGVYYIIRRRLLEAGIDPDHQGKNFRKNLTARIDDICEKLGFDREEIGIYAGTRAFFYFRGKEYPVKFDNVFELMRNGTDIILIEKEGMADVLRPFTDPAGIAIITNKGFFVKYASKLAKNAEVNGANIAIVTDFDISGLQMERSMHEEIYGIPRLGIDFQTLDYFGISREEVEEHINTEKPTRNTESTSYNHWQGLRKKGRAYWRGESPDDFIETMRYLEMKRIEIDNVVTHPNVGNERFAKYIIDRLTKEFPTRNYNRVIQVPDYITPDVLSDLNRVILSKTRDVTKDKRYDIKEQLRQTEGIIDDVSHKEREIKQELTNLVSMDTRLGPILERLQKLIDELEET